MVEVMDDEDDEDDIPTVMVGGEEEGLHRVSQKRGFPNEGRWNVGFTLNNLDPRFSILYVCPLCVCFCILHCGWVFYQKISLIPVQLLFRFLYDYDPSCIEFDRGKGRLIIEVFGRYLKNVS